MSLRPARVGRLQPGPGRYSASHGPVSTTEILSFKSRFLSPRPGVPFAGGFLGHHWRPPGCAMTRDCQPECDPAGGTGPPGTGSRGRGPAHWPMIRDGSSGSRVRVRLELEPGLASDSDVTSSRKLVPTGTRSHRDLRWPTRRTVIVSLSP
jgi:hypothetical protein